MKEQAVKVNEIVMDKKFVKENVPVNMSECDERREVRKVCEKMRHR